LKYTEGFSRLFPSLLTVAAMALSRNSICRLDRHRCGRHGGAWHNSVQ
jgi:hypothetical protein